MLHCRWMPWECKYTWNMSRWNFFTLSSAVVTVKCDHVMNSNSYFIRKYIQLPKLNIVVQWMTFIMPVYIIPVQSWPSSQQRYICIWKASTRTLNSVHINIICNACVCVVCLVKKIDPTVYATIVYNHHQGKILFPFKVIVKGHMMWRYGRRNL